MTTKFYISTAFFLLIMGIELNAQESILSSPIVTKNVIFEENNGHVAVEAEYFFKQEETNIRKWYRTSKNEISQVMRDDDVQHCHGASNSAYLKFYLMKELRIRMN